MIAKEKALGFLKTAIVQQAAEDYREAYKNNDKKMIADVESFFKSKHGMEMTLGNGIYILNLLKKEVGAV